MTVHDSIPHRLAALATQAGTLPALIDSQGTVWTRSHLQRQLSSLAALFMAAGIQPGDRIATATGGGISAAWAFLGAACYTTAVPLNAALGRQDLEVLFADLEPRALLTNLEESNPVCHAAIKSGVNVLRLPTPAAPTAEGHQPLPPCQVDLDDAALILYTSGTTSAPKRVVLTHTHLLASTQNIRFAINLQPADRCLNPMPLFHSHGLVAGLLAPLLTGGSVILPDTFDVTSFFDVLTQLQPSWYTAVPTIHQAIAHGLEQGKSRHLAHRLRLVRSASAPLPPSVMEQLEKHLGVPVIETYGMTEATNQITSNLLPPRQRKPGSAGKPVGMDLRIVDATGASLPQGATGEVIIRGNSVVSGYENNADASAAAFNGGWFRTGDLGYVDADGYVFLVGRSKELINRGGEKIAPREVEEALLQHPCVTEAIAFAIPHPTLGEDLAAAVIQQPEASESEQDLRLFLFEQVAETKVPSRILLLEALPKGPTHKPLRVGLANVLQDRLTTDYVAPATPFECALADIWSAVLGEQAIGRDDNFFLLGGDSLSAVRVTSRIRRAMGIDLDLRQLFVHPVLKDQATLLLRDALSELNANACDQTA